MLNLILKGTNSCNLACSYCSLGKKNNTQKIDCDNLIKIFKYMCEMCRFRNDNTLSIILHGGEPTLISPEVYDKALSVVMKEFSDIKILVSMQTNALNISQSMFDFIKKYDVNIGVSIDGSKVVHDKERRTLKGQATFDKVTANIVNMLKQDINVSCLMVLTSNALYEGYDFLEFFEKNHLHLKINPLLNYGEVYEHPELSLHTGEYANYLIEMYKYIIRNKMSVMISPLDKILNGILNDTRIPECTFSKECNKNFLCIDYNGDIYPCGKYSDMNEFKLSNIELKEYDILNKMLMKRLLNRRSACLPDKCAICEYLKLCHAGCNAEASIDGQFSKPPILCEDYKMLFEFFYGEGLVLLKQQLLEHKKTLLEER